ncbi:MAG: type II secretion system protein [Planctomycetota bacterium]|nr:type II secretion system protein [Planctomycetota bacterium]
MTRRAFSLLEMVVSLGVVALIGAALASSMVLAARASPREDDAVSRTLAARRIAERVASDVSLATAIVARSAHAVELTLADQDQDDVHETVSWAWSGTPGDPLVRAQNGKQTHAFDDVHAFSIDWDTVNDSVTAATAGSYGSEVLLASFDDDADGSTALTASTRVAQFICPTLPAGATHYSISRLRVRVSPSSILSATLVADCTLPDGDDLPGTVESSASALLALNLPAASWITFDFSGFGAGPSDIPAGTGRWFVFRQALLPFVSFPTQSAVANTEAGVAVSTSSGASWGARPDVSLRYELYGLVKQPGTIVASAARASGVRVHVDSGGSDGEARAGAGMPARPLLPALSATPLVLDISVTADEPIVAEDK